MKVRQSGAISNGGAILKGQIFSKLHELTSSLLKDIIYYYSRLYPPTLSSEVSVVSEIFEPTE